jgi:hypothetical protein
MRLQHFLIVFLICLGSNLFGQEPENPMPSPVFSSNHVSVMLQTGFTRGKAESVTGPFSIRPQGGLVFQGNLNYTFNFSEELGISVGTGLGAFPINFEFNEYSEGSNYFDDTEYKFFGSLRSELNLRKRLSNKYILNGFGGINTIYTSEGEYITGSGSSQFPGGLYFVLLDIKRGWKQGLHVGTGITKILKNKDHITLRLDYHRSSQPFYSGSYIVYPTTPDRSTGKFLNNGHFINLGLAYTLTGKDKEEQFHRYLNNNFSKDSERDLKKERRKIAPGTTFIGASGGATFPLTRATDPNNLFISTSMADAMPYLYLEQNFKQNLFAEGGFGFQTYFSANRFKFSPLISAGNAFNAYQITLGGGKRLIGKTNHYNYLNLSAGMVLTFINEFPGLKGSSGGLFVVDGDTIYNLSSENYLTSTFSPLLYLGASKDLRLTEKLYFTILYRYHQGFRILYEQRLNYTSAMTQGIQNAKYCINGSFHTFQLGLKYNLGNLSEKQHKQQSTTSDVFVSLMPGLCFYKEFTENQYGKYNSSASGLTIQAGIEKHYKSFFIESRLGFQKIHMYYLSQDIANAAIGLGKKIELPSGFKLFNIHGGLTSGFVTGITGLNEENYYVNEETGKEEFLIRTFSPETGRGIEISYTLKEGQTVNYGKTEFGVERRFIPAVYAGLSRDFKLSKKFSFGLVYLRNQGFIVSYREQGGGFTDSGERFFSKTTLNGTANFVLMNLKYKIK